MRASGRGEAKLRVGVIRQEARDPRRKKDSGAAAPVPHRAVVFLEMVFFFEGFAGYKVRCGTQRNSESLVPTVSASKTMIFSANQ